MPEEQDSWFKAAFGVDLASAVGKLKDEAVTAVGKVKDAVVTVAAAGAAAAATGAFPLGGSVGRKGKNVPGDVRAVQKALGIAADGECGPKTIAAIKAYQRKLGAAKPDGRVDAGGATERALAGLAKPPPAEPSAAVDSIGSITPSYSFEPAWPTKLAGPGLSDKGNDLVDDLLQQQAALLQSLGNAGSAAEAEQIREELAGVGDEIAMELAALKREEESEAAELGEAEEPANTETDESYNEDLNVEDKDRDKDKPWQGERPLTAYERSQAQKIYQDSIDYDKVSIAAGSLGSVGGASRTIGNTICLQDEEFQDNTSSLKPEGLSTLIHELGHVWQYQHGGLSYIPDALQAQAASTIATGDRNAAYEWRRAVQEGKDWKDWNAEQQAMAMEDYFNADAHIEAAKAAGSSPAPEDVEVVRTLEQYRTYVRSGRGAPGGPSEELGDFVSPQGGDSAHA